MSVGHLIQRDDIVDIDTYEDQRMASRPAVLKAKRNRRVHLGEHLTLLFENRTTLGYQVQEIMRAERIVREADIVSEIQVYNSILGEPGDLGCVLQIEIADPAMRKDMLTRWHGLQARIYVRLADGTQVFARFDPSQVGADRLSAVQYLQFRVGGQPPMAVGTDFHDLESEVELTADQVGALTEDLTTT